MPQFVKYANDALPVARFWIRLVLGAFSILNVLIGPL